MDRATMAVFTGNANPQLAQDIARHLMVPLGRAAVSRFSDLQRHAAFVKRCVLGRYRLRRAGQPNAGEPRDGRSLPG